MSVLCLNPPGATHLRVKAKVLTMLYKKFSTVGLLLPHLLLFSAFVCPDLPTQTSLLKPRICQIGSFSRLLYLSLDHSSQISSDIYIAHIYMHLQIFK